MMYHRLVKTLLNSLQIKYLETYRERTRVLSSAGRASPLQNESQGIPEDTILARKPLI